MFNFFTAVAKLYFKLYVEENCTFWTELSSFAACFQRGGAEGIGNILGEKNDDGQVRATRTKSVIAKIVDHFNV